ncbi:MAG TPA: methionyl-tRNA formyltransferase [Dehalococcoidia bacterium]|nr:methionyl-tRNA formyltransferase [Dehalococcoidia bacterium]
MRIGLKDYVNSVFTHPTGIKNNMPDVWGVKGFFDIKHVLMKKYFIMKNKLIFMGTPEFAVPCLEALIDYNDIQIVAVYTQPDKEAGRGRQLTASPVKLLAQTHNLPLLQPDSLKNSASLEALQALHPDIIVVAAYGKIIPVEILAVPPYGYLNLHPSLLPRYRGATPIPAAILNGDGTSGVSIILLDPGMDSGPILKQRKEPVRDDDTADSLGTRLAQIAADLLMEVLPLWLKGKIQPRPQDDSRATYTRPIQKEDGRIDWNQDALLIWRKVRAYAPWPGCFSSWRGKNLKITRAVPLDHVGAAVPGSVITLKGMGGVSAGVVCGKGVLGLLQLQLEGKREMGAEEFVNGHRNFVGSRLL